MEPRRIVVGTSLANVNEASRAPLVGLLTWTTPTDEWCSIIVKARVARGAPDTILRPETFFARPAQADPLQRPVDFVPTKRIIDVAVVGHVDLPGVHGQPVRISGTLTAGGDMTPLDLQAPQPGRVPLTLPHARVRGEEGIDGAVGPMNLHDGATLGFKYDDDFGFELYQCASRPYLLREKLVEGSQIALGLVVKGKSETIVELQLPSVSPRMVLDPSVAGRRMAKVVMTLDTVLVDVDRAELELTWRAYFQTYAGVRDIDRVLLGWASDAEMAHGKGWQNIFRELPRGRFDHAWFFEDADRGKPPPPLTPQEEKVARYQTWLFPLAPEPRLDLDQYAEITVELSERREPRADILARHGLDEHSFALEERGWLERVTGETRQHVGKPPTAPLLVEARHRATERLKLRRLAAQDSERRKEDR